MKKNIFFILILLINITSKNYAQNVPINDNPIGAINLTIGTNFESNSIITTNEFATDSDALNPTVPLSSCSSHVDKDIWFTVTIPESGNIIIETQAAQKNVKIQFNTGVAIYSGEIGNLKLIECNGSIQQTKFSEITLTDQTPGEQLFIRTWVDDSLTASFLISSFTYDSPTNDEPIAAIDLTTGTNFQSNSIIANNEFATDSEILDPNIPTPECANYAGKDLWYTATVPQDGSIIIETQYNSSTFLDNGIAVYSGEIGNLTFIECTDTKFRKGLRFSQIILTNQTPGEQLYVRTWRDNLTDQDSYSIATYALEEPLVNDEPIGAINLTVGTDFSSNSIIINNEFATDSENFSLNSPDPSCTNFKGKDVWYSATIPNNGNITVQTGLTNFNLFDTGIAIYSGEISNLNLVACDDSIGNSFVSKITLANQIPGQNIFIRTWIIDDFFFEDYRLSAYSIELPVNDEPNNAVILVVGSSFDDKALIASNNLATNSEDFNNSIPDINCSNYLGGDIWYSVEVPSSGSLIIESKPNEFSIVDSDLAVYSGTLNNLSEISCNDGETINNYYPIINIENRTPGEIIFIRLWSSGLSDGSEYLISAYKNESILNTNPPLDINHINYYPNPVNDYLIVNTKSILNDQSIKLFTSSGKEISVQTEASVGIAKLYMNNLASGIYFVHIKTANKTDVLKVFKQ